MTEHCEVCGCEVHGFLTGRKYIDGKVHCSECYYKKLGDAVEQHPLGMPIDKHTHPISDKKGNIIFIPVRHVDGD